MTSLAVLGDLRAERARLNREQQRAYIDLSYAELLTILTALVLGGVVATAAGKRLVATIAETVSEMEAG